MHPRLPSTGSSLLPSLPRFFAFESRVNPLVYPASADTEPGGDVGDGLPTAGPAPKTASQTAPKSTFSPVDLAVLLTGSSRAWTARKETLGQR